MKNPVSALIPIAALVALSACGGAPKQVNSLDAAHTAYLTASADEVIAKHAASELDEARLALAKADRLYRDDAKIGHTEHYAYVASQKVKIAELIAQRKEDDARLESMNLERQRVQLDVRSQQVDRAREQTLAMQRQLEDMQAQVTARGIVATLGDVLFDIGQASLKSTATGNVDKIANFMRSHPDRSAIVEGHTDNMGGDEFNEASPIADNNTAAGRQKNRRVEVIFPDLNKQLSELDAQ